MQTYFYQLKILFKRLLVLFFIYSLCRLIFFFFNYSYFSSSGFAEIFKSFFYGIKFDAAAIFITNSLFILLSILPVIAWFKSWYSYLLKTIFIIINIPCLLLNSIDFIYFRFILKRTTSDWFNMLGLGDDAQNLILKTVLDFWYALVILIVLIILMIYLYNRIKVNTKVNVFKKKTTSLPCWLLMLPLAGVSVIIARGGVAYKPLRIISAAGYSVPQNAQLILNTPFTVIKTLGKTELEDIKYMKDDECKKYFSSQHQFKKSAPFKPYNVVVIILESFSKEYIGGLNNYEGYTPFLDSLMNEALVFTNAYANSKKSIEGIPAVTAGIPALMSEPFITSAYNGNRVNSIASVLKGKGYSTGFFHGGNNGTMGFDNFAKATGFDFYKGRNEYGKKDYDGSWGVYDEKFYQFCLSEMNKMKKPFMTCVFSLTSHHPYSVPPEYKGTFKNGTMPIHESIMYADYSLKTFFESASRQSWFDSTLFVITADHTGPAEHPFYKNQLGIFAVPILFYQHNSQLRGNANTVTQQADIMPGILDYLNYDKEFSAFGNSALDTTVTHFAVNFLSDNYQLILGDYLLQFDGEKNIALFDYRKDSLLTQNILQENKMIAEKNSMLLKSIIQQFNGGMIHNEIVRK